MIHIRLIGDVMMEQMDNLLLVDANDERRQQLETVLSFMGIQWQSGGKKIVWLIFLRWKIFRRRGGRSETTTLPGFPPVIPGSFYQCGTNRTGNSNVIGFCPSHFPMNH